MCFCRGASRLGEHRPGDSGAYVNSLGNEGEERVGAAYADSTWERLAAVKRRDDPGNLFRLNQTVPPATEGKPRMTSLATIPDRELAPRRRRDRGLPHLDHETNRVKVRVDDARSGERFELSVDGRDALDAYNHPFA